MDIQQIMKKAQDLQTKMEKAQNTMKDQKIPGTAAGGGVKVTLTGQGKAHEIQIMWDTVKSSKIFSSNNKGFSLSITKKQGSQNFKLY